MTENTEKKGEYRGEKRVHSSVFDDSGALGMVDSKRESSYLNILREHLERIEKKIGCLYRKSVRIDRKHRAFRKEYKEHKGTDKYLRIAAMYDREYQEIEDEKCAFEALRDNRREQLAKQAAWEDWHNQDK